MYTCIICLYHGSIWQIYIIIFLDIYHTFYLNLFKKQYKTPNLASSVRLRKGGKILNSSIKML